MTVNDTIAAQVAAMQAGRPPRPEGEPPNAFELDRTRLVTGFDSTATLRVGSTLADVELLDVDGGATTLFAALGDQTTVLVFYRGEWCPYCSIALRTYQRELVPVLDKFDAQLVAISPQRPDGSLTAKEKNELSFTVLSDPGNRLARQFGIVITPSNSSLDQQRSRGLDLTERNADGSADLPMPTVVIIDANRIARFIDVHPDYATRTEPTEVVDALSAL
jgi:peroxiredoxin